MITKTQLLQAMQVYNQQLKTQGNGRKEGAAAPPKPQGRDEVILSQQSKELALAIQAAKALPEVDTEKVTRLRQEIEAGTYQVSDAQIAAKILEYHNLNLRV